MSRDLKDLDPRVQEKAEALIEQCKEVGIDLLVTCTKRSMEEQAALYAQGRTSPGGVVTNAKPGQSAHNYGLAFDVVPVRNGKPVWNTTGEDGVMWQHIGALGVSLGLEWAGHWLHFKEFPHFQWLGGLTIADLQSGKRP